MLYLLALLILAAALLFVPLPSSRTIAASTIENAGHMPLFLVVSLGLLTVLRSDFNLRGWVLYATGIATGLLAALASEAIQRPLARDASWEDVFADALGVACGAALFAVFDPALKSRRLTRLAALAVALACLAVYVAPLVRMTLAYIHRNNEFPVIADFNSRSELFWVVGYGARREVANGALEVEFQADEFPGVSLFEPMRDWRKFSTLIIDVENPAGEILNLGVRVHDRMHRRVFADRFNRRFELAPGERRTLRISLADIRSAPRGRSMDMEHISDITLFRGEKTGSRRLRIYSLRLE